MLSKRLLEIAKLVTTESVIDVGCDHGYLDIYLTKAGIRCLATDISEPSLNKAILNFKKNNLVIDTKLTDGLNGIDIKNTDTIIISGMGTDTIIKILNKSIDCDLIIASNNHLEKLRRYVVSLGYYIDCEKFVMENNKPYIIIKFKKGYRSYNDMDYVIGTLKDPSYFEYLISKYTHILKNLPPSYSDKIKYYKNLINFLEK